MKFAFVLLAALVFAQSVVAFDDDEWYADKTWTSSSDPNWPARASIPGSHYIDDLLKWLKETSKMSSGKLTQAVNRVIKEVSSLLEQAQNDSVGTVFKLVGMISNLKQYANDNVVGIASDIRNILDDVEKKVQAVLGDVSIKFDQVMEKANSTLFDATRQLQNWRIKMEAQLEDAPADKKAKGIAIIEEFVNKSIAECFNCSHGAIQPIKKLYNQVKKLVDNNTPLARGIVDKVESCIKTNGFNVQAIGKCLKDVKGYLVEAIKSIPAQVIALKVEVLSMAMDELLNLPCIASSRLNIEVGKNEIQDKIFELLAADRFLRSLITHSL